MIREKNMYGKKVMGIVRSTFLTPKARRGAEWRKVVKGHAADVLAESAIAVSPGPFLMYLEKADLGDSGADPDGATNHAGRDGRQFARDGQPCQLRAVAGSGTADRPVDHRSLVDTDLVMSDPEVQEYVIQISVSKLAANAQDGENSSSSSLSSMIRPSTPSTARWLHRRTPDLLLATESANWPRSPATKSRMSRSATFREPYLPISAAAY
ncbi:MAG: hypothetical protein R3F24_09980 [Gammaproteobacteria bacterium]